MQIAPMFRNESTAPAAAPGVIRVPDANRVLATATVRFADLEDGHTYTDHLQLVAGGRLGSRVGYATLREAMFELGVSTRGERVGAAAVIERNGRFYGHALKGRDLSQGLRAPLRQAYFEEDARSAVVELRARDRFERLRALVDGGWTHRFRS
jgi:hypothetical protein